MTLSEKQRAELDRLGPATVRSKLLQGGTSKSAPVPGFDHAVTLQDAEVWLAEKHLEEMEAQNSTLIWGRIAGYAGIVAAIAGVIAAIAAVIAAWPVVKHWFG